MAFFGVSEVERGHPGMSTRIVELQSSDMGLIVNGRGPSEGRWVLLQSSGLSEVKCGSRWGKARDFLETNSNYVGEFIAKLSGTPEHTGLRKNWSQYDV